MEPSEKLTIDTPEQIPLEFPLAGIGSRFLALVIDTLAQFVAGGVIVVALLILFGARIAALEGHGAWAAAAAVLALFALHHGYFALFEALWSGQTPGKRLMDLRVIADAGRPIAAHQAIARNLMRIIDALPGLYAFGIVSALLNRQNKRLGDLVAGTVVVHERPLVESKPDWDAAAPARPAGPEAARLTPQDGDLIETFLLRRRHLEPAVRDQTSRSIAERIARALGVPLREVVDAERFLEDLARDRRRGPGRAGG